jgi:hypothetical protein
MKRTKLFTYSLILLLSILHVVLNAQNPAVRHVPDSVTNSFKNGKGYEYANDPAYWKKGKPAGPPDFISKLFNPTLWKLIGYLFLVAMFGIVIYRLIANGVFYRKENSIEKLNNPDDVNLLDESTLTALLKEFLRDGKFREAIRAQYLLTLVSLEKTGMIKITANSTNHEYSDQLKNHKAYSAFTFLTRMYEYAWYGDVKVSQQDYAFAEKRFIDFKKQF